MKIDSHYRTVLLLLCVLVAIASQAEIYRWVDDKGQVHFGDKPGSTDHEVIRQQEEDFSTIGVVPKADSTEVNSDAKNKDENQAEDVTSGDNVTDSKDADKVSNEVSGTEDKSVASDDETLSEEERQRLKRIEEMEALAEELRIAREKRESVRQKEKEELKALREGCARANERIEVLQAQINHYIESQSNRSGDRQPKQDVKLDTKRKRMAAELTSRQEFVKQNCNNL